MYAAGAAGAHEHLSEQDWFRFVFAGRLQQLWPDLQHPLEDRANSGAAIGGKRAMAISSARLEAAVRIGPYTIPRLRAFRI